MAEFRVGTSGYAYKEWKANFYPEKLADREMLGFYSQKLRTVEINYTFYRMPAEKLLLGWAEQVPDGFHFALKTNQQITHVKRLRDSAGLLGRFLQAASVLQDRNQLGPVLVQLPPYFHADLKVLEEFLKLRPQAFRFALEVRHASWHTEEMYALLRDSGTALCLAETEKQTSPEVVTTDFVYIRLRSPSYTPTQLAAWRKRCDAWLSQGIDVYAYFKHEDAGKAPQYAQRLLAS